jgi:hypothetical protein
MAKLTAEESRELSEIDGLIDDGTTLTPEQQSRHFRLVRKYEAELEWEREKSGYYDYQWDDLD